MADTAVPALPPMNAATLLRALLKRPRRAAAPAGAVTSTFALARIDPAQVQRYRTLLGFRGDDLPLTFYYLLAQRAHLATMLQPQFPFRIAGMIHVANALEEQGAPRLDAPLLLATAVRTETRASGAVHVVLETRASQQGRPIFTCSSDYVVVRGRHGRAAGKAAPPAPLPVAVGSWRLGLATGRQYAAVSGDWNPIHLYPWSARLFGLPAPIIHGMHTMGKACALLEAALGRRIVALSGRFVSPIALGSEAALAADLAAGTFSVAAQGRRAVEGSYRAAA